MAANEMVPGQWVVAGKPAGELPEVGKVYEVRHSRKGTFKAKVLRVSGEWCDVEVVDGVAKAVMSYNVAIPGDQLSIRDVHSYFAGPIDA